MIIAIISLIFLVILYYTIRRYEVLKKAHGDLHNVNHHVHEAEINLKELSC